MPAMPPYPDAEKAMPSEAHLYAIPVAWYVALVGYFFNTTIPAAFGVTVVSVYFLWQRYRSI